jgi:hypothetical protein
MVLRHKYGHLTLGTAGTYNHRHFGPERQGVYYADTFGLAAPVNATAISAGEDSASRPLPPWSPFQSWAYFRYQCWLIYTNSIQLVVGLSRFCVFSIFILIAAAAALWKGWLIDRTPGRPVLVLLLAIIVFPTGYVILHVEDRYLATSQILIFVVGIFLLEKIPWFTNRQNEFCIAAGVLCISIMLHPMMALQRHRWINEDVYDKAQELKAIIPDRGRVACDSRAADSPIDETLFLSFHNDYAFYGRPRPTDTPEQTIEELKNFGIQYYFVWDDPAPWPFLRDWQLLWHATVEDRPVWIYRVPPL